MSSLSQFFPQASGGSGGGSFVRIFNATGSMSIPADAAYLAYVAIGGGGGGAVSTSGNLGGAGGGFSYMEGPNTSGAHTICAIVGAGGKGGGCVICNTDAGGTGQSLGCHGGNSCVTGISPGNICATGGRRGEDNTTFPCGGTGSGGIINTRGGGGQDLCCNSQCIGGYRFTAGHGAGGLQGNGGIGGFAIAAGGGGFGSGGGGGGGGLACIRTKGQSGGWLCVKHRWPGGRGSLSQCAGTYSQPHTYGSPGYSATTPRSISGNNECQTVLLAAENGVSGFYAGYALCGYSQIKTFVSASGSGGDGSASEASGQRAGDGGAGGGGGGSGSESGRGGNGGFGGGGGSTCCGGTSNANWFAMGGGDGGIGAGGGGGDAGSACCSRGGNGGNGLVMVEYWY